MIKENKDKETKEGTRIIDGPREETDKKENVKKGQKEISYRLEKIEKTRSLKTRPRNSLVRVRGHCDPV